MVAIEILEFYLQKLQRAKSVINRFSQITGGRGGMGGMGGAMNLGFDDIVNMAVAVEQKKRGSSGNPLETGELQQDLSDEDIKRMKATVDKVRGKTVTTAQ